MRGPSPRVVARGPRDAHVTGIMLQLDGPMRQRLLCAEEGLTWLLSAMQKTLDAKERHDLRNALSIVVAFRQLFDEPADDGLLTDARAALSRVREMTCDALARSGRPRLVV